MSLLVSDCPTAVQMVVPRFLRNSVQPRATLWDGFVGSNVGCFAPPLPVPEPGYHGLSSVDSGRPTLRWESRGAHFSAGLDPDHPHLRPPNLRGIGESKPRNVSFLREATRANQGPAGSP